MEALVFAAGKGTRLGALTRTTPKALVDVGGKTLLDRVAERLVSAGVDRIVVTVSHFGEEVEAHLATRSDWGAEVVVSREPGGPYETGGGLWAARSALCAREPFFLHNVDVLSDLPLARMYAAHLERAPLATLAVMDRATRRRLLFDDDGLLGRRDDAAGVDLRVRPARGPVVELGFQGVHVVSPTLLDRITERGTFPILDVYLRLAAAGARFLPHRVDGCTWVDAGKPEGLEQARRAFHSA